MAGIDLHTHSTASDGSLPPAEVARMAARAGLSAVALTDHDTVDGLAEFASAGRELGIEAVPGCELSVEGEGPAFHIVGLWVPFGDSPLSEELRKLRQNRHERNRLILKKLAAVGVDIDYEEVRAKADGTVGRPHIAATLIERGVCATVSECFDRFLGSRGAAYVPKKSMSSAEAFGLLRSVGATPVLAHPMFLRLGPAALEERVREYVKLGLGAIEAYYTDHDPAQTETYLALARKLNLGVSGGSDFHGAAKPDAAIGVGRGNLRIPESALADLKARRRALGLDAQPPIPA